MLREVGYPVVVACAVLDLAHSSYYYQSEKKDEYELEEAIEQVTGEFPKYGTRRVSQHLLTIFQLDASVCGALWPRKICSDR